MRTSNFLLLLIPSFIWGSTWYAIKFQIGETDPLFSVGYRFALAGGLLLAFSYFKGYKLKFSLKDYAFMGLQGICLFGLNYWLVYMAEEHLESGLVAVIFACLVFMNIFMSALFLRLPVKPKVILGAFFGIGGILLIFKNELTGFDLKNDNLMGFILAMSSVFLASFGNILSAYNQRNKIPLIQTNAFGMLIGSAVVLSVGLISGKTMAIDTSFAYVASLAYLVIFGSVIAFSIYLNVLGKIGPDKAGYMALIMPVIALTISTFLEGYQWTYSGVTGVGLILFGVYMALIAKKRKVRVQQV